MNFAVLLGFVAILLVCVVAGISVLYALLMGYILFAAYSLSRGFSVKELIKMSVEGIRTARNVIITFILIGILTALWRQGGTIPAIVAYASTLIHPSVFLVMTFLLNCLLSFLTGTAFGTAATMYDNGAGTGAGSCDYGRGNSVGSILGGQMLACIYKCPAGF